MGPKEEERTVALLLLLLDLKTKNKSERNKSRLLSTKCKSCCREFFLCVFDRSLLQNSGSSSFQLEKFEGSSRICSIMKNNAIGFSLSLSLSLFLSSKSLKDFSCRVFLYAVGSRIWGLFLGSFLRLTSSWQRKLFVADDGRGGTWCA